VSLSAANLAALGLVALAALPILAHLARQVPRDRRPFGAMLLIERVVKRLRRRRRVKDRWLLLARLLAVALLALAVVDPRVSWPGVVPEFGGTGRVVLVIDRSLSMSAVENGGTALQRARDEAARILSRLPSGVLVGAVAYDTRAERLTPSLTADTTRVAARIVEIVPTYGTSDLRGALLEARRLLGGEPGEVILLSDEAGPRMIAESKGEIERLVQTGSAIFPLPLAGAHPRNIAVESAEWTEGIDGGRVVVRLRNYGDAAAEVPCEISLPDGRRVTLFVDVPPLGPAEEAATLPADATGGIGEVRCEEPDLPLDDARWFHLPQAGATRVLVVDGDPGETPTRSETYFLERALAPWGGGRSDVAIDVTTLAGLETLDPARHRVVFLANVADPRQYGPRLVEFVRGGGALVIGAGDNVTAGPYNAALAGILPSEIRRPRGMAGEAEDGVPLQLPTMGDPLLEPFSRAGRGGFAKVHAGTILTVEPFVESDDVQTLLAWEGGLPALIERRVGSGRVLLWTSSFDLAWGDLPLQAVFMPLMLRMVEVLGAHGGANAGRVDATVGGSVSVPLPDGALGAEVFGPDGAPVRSRTDGGAVSFVPDRPGAWSVGLPDVPPIARVAVNTAPDESDIRPYDSVAAVEQDLSPGLLSRTLDLGPLALGAGLGALVIQAFAALRGARRSAQAVEAL
jgi:hypothetical protein